MSRTIGGAVLAGALLVWVWVAFVPGTLGAQTAEPSEAETARLLGYLWADGSQDGDIWDATAPSGARTLIEELVERHDGEWVERTELRFRLPDEYPWEDWLDGLPDDDARVIQAVENPHFLAALLEGEGSTDGLVYDQSSCCTPFSRGRLTELGDLLGRHGFQSTTLTTFTDLDSGEVRIESSEFRLLRDSLEFVCTEDGDHIRVPGGEQYATHGPIQWLGTGTTFGTLVREDCVEGQQVRLLGPAVGDCIVTVDPNQRLRVSWSFALGDVVVERDGANIARVSARDGFVVDNPPTRSASYAVRIIDEDVVTARGCGTRSFDALPEGPPPVGLRCNDQIITILGTAGNDELVGTDGADVIHGFDGNDRISGLDGRDVLCGGSGNDVITAGFGADTIFGGIGDDNIAAGGGSDTVWGNDGDDVLFGNNGVDTIMGEAGNDRLHGNRGIDLLDGGSGDDGLIGGKRLDECRGGGGANTFNKCETIR